MSPVDEARLLREQADYYRARAGEYDRWFLRVGRYDRGEAATRAWFEEVDEVRRALDRLPLDGADVLELAAGTGIWTERLARRAGSLTAIDASVEMIERNRERLGAGAAGVDYRVADLFAWEPTRQWDAVVFCFWISHVPAARLGDFISRVARAVRPGGAVFFVDSRREPTSTAADHVLPPSGDDVMVRRLDDGREFRIVKSFRSAEALETGFAAGGLTIEVHETATFFQWGAGTRTG